MSINDVCLALQCGRTLVYELLKRGELRAIKLGRLTRVSRATLEDLIARKERDTTDEFHAKGLADDAVAQPPALRALLRSAVAPTGTPRKVPRVGAGEQPWLLDLDDSAGRPPGRRAVAKNAR